MKVIAKNRKARHDYTIEKTLVAGVVLQGSEVKAIRMGRIQLRDSFVMFRNGEPWAIGVHIGEYPNAHHFVHEAKRDRKLLLGADEIKKLIRQVQEKGNSIIPLDAHFTEKGWIKLTLGVGTKGGHRVRGGPFHVAKGYTGLW